MPPENRLPPKSGVRHREVAKARVSVWVPAWNRPKAPAEPSYRLHGARDKRGSPPPIAVEGYDQVAEVLRHLRLARGWTQAELDLRVGWADGYAGKVEQVPGSRGRRRALPDTLAEWITALQAPRVELRFEASPAPVSLLDEPRLRLWRFWAAVEGLRGAVIENPGVVGRRYE